MTEELENDREDWIVVEGPGTETTDEDVGPTRRDLGREPALGAGYGVSTGDVEGEPGGPGPALDELPEHTGPNAVVGIEGLAPAEDEGEEEEPE